ncbi:MAG: hypothetical protein ACLQRH_13810 [Acidimicrobiales bacterium]
MPKVGRPTAGGYCTGCGQPTPGTTSDPGCPGCGRTLDPPRFCPECGRRMAVRVAPTGWAARCQAHGELRSPDVNAASA